MVAETNKKERKKRKELAVLLMSAGFVWTRKEK